MSAQYHPLVKRLLDGELSLAELPAELRAEGEQALRLIRGVDRAPVTLPAALDTRVMATVRRHAASPVRRAWRRLTAPRDVELRLRVRPWTVWAGALAAAAAVVLLVSRAPAPSSPPHDAAPLRPAGTNGVWATTLAVPIGQHQYAFIVDGERWVADPRAPAVDDGFGRRNSVVAVIAQGARTL